MVPDNFITAGTADNGRIALNPEKQEALLEACNAGDEALVRSLLAEGNVSLDIPDVEGWTALHWCIAHPAVVKLVLTKADTQIDARDRAGEQCSASAELTSHIRRTFHNSSFRCSM
jgi:ankyrin repeat protein